MRKRGECGGGWGLSPLSPPCLHFNSQLITASLLFLFVPQGVAPAFSELLSAVSAGPKTLGERIASSPAFTTFLLKREADAAKGDYPTTDAEKEVSGVEEGGLSSDLQKNANPFAALGHVLGPSSSLSPMHQHSLAPASPYSSKTGCCPGSQAGGPPGCPRACAGPHCSNFWPHPSCFASHRCNNHQFPFSLPSHNQGAALADKLEDPRLPWSTCWTPLLRFLAPSLKLCITRMH